MKRALFTIFALAVAGVALADPPEFTSIEEYKKIQPTVQYCWNADHYEACPVGDVSGSTVNLGSIGTAATAANQTTAQASLSSIDTKLSGGTQVVKGIPAPCASAPLTKLYQTTNARRSPAISLGATYTWAVVTNLDTTKQVGIRLAAADTDPYVIPAGASMPTIYPAAGVANLYVDTSTTPTSGGSTTYLSIYACP